MARADKPILGRSRRAMFTLMGRSWLSRLLHSTWPGISTMSRAMGNKGSLTRILTLQSYGREHSLILWVMTLVMKIHIWIRVAAAIQVSTIHTLATYLIQIA